MERLASLLVRSRDNVVRSTSLLAAARTLVSQSRRLRRPRVSGGSDGVEPVTPSDHATRGARTTERTRRGTLPAAVGLLRWRWVGPGMGMDCDGCRERIDRAERELEVEVSSTLVFRFHVGCFSAWSEFKDG